MKSDILKRVFSMFLCLTEIIFVSTASITALTVSLNSVAADAEISNLEPSKNEYKIVSPVPSGSTVTPITQPPRLDTLRGKTIALVGGSFSASVTHAVIRDMLVDEYDCKIYFMDEIGKGGTYNPNNQSKQSKDFQQRLLDYNVDAVISGNCGCGICTVKETGNALAAEATAEKA